MNRGSMVTAGFIFMGAVTIFLLGYTAGRAAQPQLGFVIHDPTYSEALQFIYEDKTNEAAYSESYNCYDFTASVKRNAFNAGIRCFFVYIEFKVAAHGVVAFNTTDRGMLYIEPKNDKVIDVSVGGRMFSDTILKVGLIP